MVVIPLFAFTNPSSNKVSIPSLMATSQISVSEALFRVNEYKASAYYFKYFLS